MRRSRSAILGVEDLADAPGGLDHADAERLGDALFDRAARRCDIELHPAAEEVIRVEHAEHQIGIGRGRLGAAAAVAGRAGRRAGAARADLQFAGRIDGRDAAAAGTDRIDVDRMHADVGAADRDFRPHDRPAVDDHADIEAGAADIGRQNVLQTDLLGRWSASPSRRLPVPRTARKTGRSLSTLVGRTPPAQVIISTGTRMPACRNVSSSLLR